MPNESIFGRLSAAIIAGDKDKLLVAIEDALREGVTLTDIIDRGLSSGMKEVGERFVHLIYSMATLCLELWEEAGPRWVAVALSCLCVK